MLTMPDSAIQDLLYEAGR